MKGIFYLCIYFITLNVFSQNSNDVIPSVRVIAKSFGDSIIIRWAPNTPLAWKLSNKAGYVVERYTIQKNGKPDKKLKPEKKLLTTSTIKPLPLEKWELVAKNNEYGAIAAQALYGNTFQITNTKSNDLIQSMTLAQELESRFSFALFSADQSLPVAKASGLVLTDRDVVKGEKYVYKVYSLVPTKSYKIDTGYVYVGTDDVFPLPKPNDLKADFADRVVMLSWNRSYFDNIYSSYFIERSDDGGKTFQRTGSLPIVNTSPSSQSKADRMYKVDSLPENNINYIFRIRGVTPFEEIGPPSDTIQGIGKIASIQLTPHITSIKNNNDGSITIDWRFPNEYNTRIKEFDLLRSDRSNGEYKILGKLKVEERRCVDKNPKRINYYIIRLTENNGNQLSSFPALGQPIDSIPPSSPNGLEGNIDFTGKLTLTWSKGVEEDLIGYRVYMANNENEEFTQITREPVRDTVFIGSVNLNTITSKVYYKIIALDLNSNISSFSKVLALKRPDLIPPVSPRVETYNATDTALFFEWTPSTSIDVVKQILYRREKGSVSWNILAEFKIDQKEYFDFKVQPSITYEYALVALDDSGLESEKKQIIRLSLIDYGIRGEIKNIETKIDRLKKQVQLTWDFSEGQPERFIIYRAVKGEPLRIYKSVTGSQRIFIDKSLSMNTEYVYSVRAAFADGSSSKCSKEINLKY